MSSGTLKPACSMLADQLHPQTTIAFGRLLCAAGPSEPVKVEPAAELQVAEQPTAAANILVAVKQEAQPEQLASDVPTGHALTAGSEPTANGSMWDAAAAAAAVTGVALENGHMHMHDGPHRVQPGHALRDVQQTRHADSLPGEDAPAAKRIKLEAV